MSTKADYTKEEWELLCSGPALAGIGVMLLDSGLIADRRELSAMAKTTSEAKAEYSGNAFVQAIVAELGTHDSKHVRHEGMTAEEVLGKLKEIDAILDKKGEENEAVVYKNFLFHVADAAANASGGFLGLGHKVSDEERTYLAAVKDILFRAPAA
ncbi:MAG: hypothetical protein ABI193_15665 [Minicystis sp.]